MFADLKNKRVLITGGGRGIGRAVAHRMAHFGCHVGITFHTGETSADATVAELQSMGVKARGFRADAALRDEVNESVRGFVEYFGGIDTLVTCAGVNRDRVVWKMSPEDWARVIDVDLNGVFHYIQAVAPLLKESRAGKIVAISSINAARGKFGQANYAAAKAGVEALVKTVARELGAYGVNVNAVAPGLTDTAMTQAMSADHREQALRDIVLGRIATPEDIADPVVFLASDAARHITGQVLRVDGGQLMS